MVGPRSSGCRTCVQRKVKCDETRPLCSRCSGTGLLCPGYGPAFQFVDEGSRIAQRVAQAASRRRAPKTNGSPELSGIHRSTEAPRPQFAYNEDVYCVFFLDRYFSFGTWNPDLQDNKSWILETLQRPSRYPVCNLALRSLVSGFFAQVHGSSSLQTTSISLHGETLAALTRSMKDENFSRSFEVLTTIALLCLYEACVYTTQNGWFRHARGLSTLVELRGPSYFKQRPARSLLSWSRYSLQMEAIVSRRRSFLERPEWKDILHSDDEGQKLSYGLTDIAIQIPGLCEDVQQLSLHPQPNATHIVKAQETREALFAVIAKLNRWWEQWRADPDRLPIRTESMPQDPDFPPRPPSSSVAYLRFSHLENAAAFCRFHAHHIMAMQWLCYLVKLFPEIEASPLVGSNRPSIGTLKVPHLDDVLGSSRILVTRAFHQKMLQHAHQIFSALPFYSLPQYAHVGAAYMGFPARVAWQTLQGSPEARWIEKFMDLMAQKSGFEVPRRTLNDLNAVCLAPHISSRTGLVRFD